MKQNIYKQLLQNKRVNNYTKLLILLNNWNYYEDYYIPNKKISKFLKLDYKNIRILLHQLETDNIITLYYKNKKRYFKFIDNETEERNNDIFHYDWLNEED